jgi:hypothetical protein
MELCLLLGVTLPGLVAVLLLSHLHSQMEPLRRRAEAVHQLTLAERVMVAGVDDLTPPVLREARQLATGLDNGVMALALTTMVAWGAVMLRLASLMATDRVSGQGALEIGLQAAWITGTGVLAEIVFGLRMFGRWRELVQTPR